MAPEQSPLAGIEIDRQAGAAAGFAAVVRLRGEHDLDSSLPVRDALASIDGDLLIDLSACGFMDSSVIGTLLQSFQDRARLGQRVELVAPPENRIITRTIEIASLRELMTVHARPPGGSPATL